jgi:hypothetical protein
MLGMLGMFGIAPGSGKGNGRGAPACRGGGGGGSNNPAFCKDANNAAGSRPPGPPAPKPGIGGGTGRGAGGSCTGRFIGGGGVGTPGKFMGMFCAAVANRDAKSWVERGRGPI